MDAASRFFEPFGANEMFLSALLGWGLQAVPGGRTAFFDAVEAHADSSSEPASVRMAVTALRHAQDVVVTVESYATVGNIDIAVFSRAVNTVLLIEHKTGSALGKLQITKYLLAMSAADPEGDRKLASVLLRPARCATRDHVADPRGVGVSCKLTHADLSHTFDVICEELDSAVLGEHIMGAARRLAFESATVPLSDDDMRSALLDELGQAAVTAGWRVASRSPKVLGLHHEVLEGGYLKVLVNPRSKSMLWCQINGSSLALAPAPATPMHLFDLWPGCRSFSFPTPFPVDRADKPWLGDHPEERARQVRVATSLLRRLPSHLAG